MKPFVTCHMNSGHGREAHEENQNCINPEPVNRQLLLERVQYAHRLWEAGISALERSFGSGVELDFADYDWQEVTLETIEAEVFNR